MILREADRARSSLSGFTLLELLVVISLLGLLVLALMGGLHVGSRVWERGTGLSQRTDDLRRATQFLSESLGNAYPMLDQSTPSHPRLRFSGEANAVKYLAPMPPVLVAAGFAEIDVRLIPGEEGMGRLIVDLRRELALADEAPWPASLLLDDVQDVDIAYFGAMDRGQEPDWQDHWQSVVALPQLIRIRVTFPPGDERTWPDLYIAPRISAEATCRFDPLTQDCRGR